MTRLTDEQLAKITERHERDVKSHTRLSEMHKDRAALLDHVGALDMELDEVRREFKRLWDWAHNWDSPFLEDDEWCEVDAITIKAAMTGEHR